MEKNPTATTMRAWKELKAQGYPGGVKLTTKELRDYFATQVSTQVSDPTTVKNLMRHTSLNTTTLYTRTVTECMKNAVRNLGADPGGTLGASSQRKNTHSDTMRELLVRLVRARNVTETNVNIKKNSGGRSRNRTYDLAHVRRAL